MSSSLKPTATATGDTSGKDVTSTKAVGNEIGGEGRLAVVTVITQTRFIQGGDQPDDPPTEVEGGHQIRTPCFGFHGCDLKTGLIIMAAIDVGRSMMSFVFLLILFYRMMRPEEKIMQSQFLAAGITFSITEMGFAVGLLSATLKVRTVLSALSVEIQSAKNLYRQLYYENRTGWVFVCHMAGWALLACTSCIYGFFFFRNEHIPVGTIYLIACGFYGLCRIYEALLVYYFVNEPVPVPVRNVIVHGHGFEVYRHPSHPALVIGQIIPPPPHPLALDPTGSFRHIGIPSPTSNV